MKYLLTANHIAEQFNMPIALLYLYEQQGLPYLLIGNLKRYEYNKVRRWFTKFNKKRFKN